MGVINGSYKFIFTSSFNWIEGLYILLCPLGVFFSLMSRVNKEFLHYDSSFQYFSELFIFPISTNKTSALDTFDCFRNFSRLTITFRVYNSFLSRPGFERYTIYTGHTRYTVNIKAIIRLYWYNIIQDSMPVYFLRYTIHSQYNVILF